MARPAAVAKAPPQSRAGTDRRTQAAASGSANNSLTTNSGWTSAMLPEPRASAASTFPMKATPIPPSQSGR